MANWLQSRLKAAEDLLEAVDRTAKTVSVPRWDQQDAPNTLGGRKSTEQDALSHLQARSSPTDVKVPHTGAEPPSMKPAGKLQHEYDAVTPDDRRVLGQDESSVPSSSALPERPLGAAETFPGASAAAPLQIPAALSSAHIPFEGTASTVMLQMPSRESGTAKWDPPRPGTPQPSDLEGAAVCLTDNSSQSAPSSMAPVAVPLPAPHVKAKPEIYPSDHSYETTSQFKDDLESSPESADQMTAEPTPKPSKAEAQAAAIAEAISAAAAAAGPAWEAAPDSSDAQLQGISQNEREVRLGRVVEQLRRRLEQLREENEQLEEELRSTDSKLTGTGERVERLEDELARAQVARVSAEASLNSAIAAQQLAEQQLERDREANAVRLAQAEAQAAKLAEENARLQSDSQASQEDMVAALRAEAAAAEQRLEEERAAHAEARRSFVAREAELEAGLAESAAALSGMQRSLDDRARRCAAAEERALSAEQRADALALDLASHQAELTARGDSSGNQGHADQSQAAEVEALSKAIEGQRAALQEATAQRQAAEERARRLQQDVDRLSSELQEAGPASDLQRQFREVTELLFQKHTQLERLAAEKAAQQLSLERELDAAREQAERVNRRARSDRSAGYLAEGDVVVPMEAMGEAYYRLANNNRVGGAVKAGAAFLDTTASTVVRVLKQYPLGRLAAFAYAIFIHLFIWILINRLQHRALSTDHLLAANATRGSFHP